MVINCNNPALANEVFEVQQFLRNEMAAFASIIHLIPKYLQKIVPGITTYIRIRGTAILSSDVKKDIDALGDKYKVLPEKLVLVV